jgi:hypothetical protein
MKVFRAMDLWLALFAISVLDDEQVQSKNIQSSEAVEAEARRI